MNTAPQNMFFTSSQGPSGKIHRQWRQAADRWRTVRTLVAGSRDHMVCGDVTKKCSISVYISRQSYRKISLMLALKGGKGLERLLHLNSCHFITAPRACPKCANLSLQSLEGAMTSGTWFDECPISSILLLQLILNLAELYQITIMMFDKTGYLFVSFHQRKYKNISQSRCRPIPSPEITLPVL